MTYTKLSSVSMYPGIRHQREHQTREQQTPPAVGINIVTNQATATHT